MFDATSPFWGAHLGAVRSCLAPVAVTYELARDPLNIGAASLPANVRLDLTRPRGLMARYICRGCGLTETFCEDPESIPIGPEYMTDAVDYPQ